MHEENLTAQLAHVLDHGSKLVPLGAGAADDREPHGLESVELSPDEQEMLAKRVYRDTFTPKAIQQQATLIQWQRVFAAWIATLPGVPRMPDCVAYARHLTRYGITKYAVRALMARADFKDLVDRMRASEQARLKELLSVDFLFYAQAHKRGLEMALESSDHRAVPAFTVPMLDRALPKVREVETPKAPLVVVNIGGGAKAEVEARILQVETNEPSTPLLEMAEDAPVNDE